MSNKLSPVVTLDGLNTVYRKLSDRIKMLGNVYHVKGNKTWAELMALTSAKQGDVYNIINGVKDTADSNRPVSVYAGCNVVCKKDITAAIKSDNWYEYWDVFEGMLEEATNNTPGVIKLGTNLDTKDAGVANDTSEIVRGLKLSGTGEHVDSTDAGNNHQAHITIPVASESTYGVVTTGAQILKGSKQLKGDLAIEGAVSIKNNNVTVNKLKAGTVQIGNVTISETNGSLSFEYNNNY